MDTKSYTSFIPKSSLPNNVVRTHSTINLFFVVTLIIFLMAMAASGGLFIYEKTLNAQIISLSKSLSDEKKNLYPENIETWKRLDDRITNAKKLMESHIASSLLFKLLEDQTMRRIQFTSMDFTPGLSGMKINLKGITDSYATLALQADVLGTESVSKYLKDTIISDVTLDDKGRVSFGISGLIDPGLVSYKDLIKSLSAEADVGGVSPTNDATVPTTN